MRRAIPWVILAVALTLRLVDLGAAGFWYDESFTGLLSRLPFDRMITATAGDTHPPLYYVITWLVYHLGGRSETWLRLPSVVFSVAGVWLTGKLADRLKLAEPVKWAAMSFLAVSSFQLHFAQEARQYALLQMLVLIALLAALNRRWVLLGVTGTALLYTHNYAVFYWPVIGMVSFVGELGHPVRISPVNQFGKPSGRKPGDEWQPRKLLITMIAPVILWLPWAVVLLGQMANVAAGYWIEPPTLGSLISVIYNLGWGFAISDTFKPLAVIVTIGLLAYALWQNKRICLLWVALAPLALVLAVGWLWKPVLLFRGLIGCVPAAVLLVADRIGNERRSALYAAVLVVPILVVGLVDHYRYNPSNKGEAASVVQQVAGQMQTGDVIYHVNDGSMVGWSYYGPELTQYEMPECARKNNGALSSMTREALGFEAVPFDELNAGRVWIVYSAGPTSTQCEIDQAERLLAGAKALLTITENELVYSGVWLAQTRSDLSEN